jgi:cbb3-type cytochrome oxidase maturation protein
MNILVILIPVSLILSVFGLIAFLWAVRNNQFEDSEGNAARILLDDE